MQLTKKSQQGIQDIIKKHRFTEQDTVFFKKSGTL